MSPATDGFSAMIRALAIFILTLTPTCPRKQTPCQRVRHWTKCWNLSKISPFLALFTYAKLAEDGIQQVFRGGLADDCLHGAHGRFAGAAKGVLVAGVDHGLQHFGSDFA